MNCILYTGQTGVEKDCKCQIRTVQYTACYDLKGQFATCGRLLHYSRVEASWIFDGVKRLEMLNWDSIQSTGQKGVEKGCKCQIRTKFGLKGQFEHVEWNYKIVE